MTAIRVHSAAGSYDAHVSRGAITRVGLRLAKIPDVSGVFVVSSPRVWRQWGTELVCGIRGWRKNRTILFDDAESSKRLSTIEQIARQLVRAGADRHSVIVALGGGVVGDVAGFAAATYLRGVRLVHVPTTLVAQVDSSIGGKTGVNLPEGKNLIGAFYPPVAVIADSEVLNTLPHREYRSGLFEVIKYGIIADAKLFAFLERRMPALLRREPRALAFVIERSLRIKARIVSRDEREGDLRQILNFGHTLGHAFEAATGYRRFLHGEAIAWGMIASSLIGVAMGRTREEESVRTIRLIASVGPLPRLTGIHASRLRPILAGDKKSRSGKLRWVLPLRVGNAEWGIEVPWTVVTRTLAELPAIAALARG